MLGKQYTKSIRRALSCFPPRSASYIAVAAPVTALVLIVLPAHAAGPTGLLNDTGITFCGDVTTNIATCATVAADGGTFPGQDARYGRDAQAAAGQLTKVGGGDAGFDFTKMANNGTVLPADAALGSGATDWACTRDNVTGLIWEVKTTSGLRSQSHTYSWYNSNPATNGGAVGQASRGSCFTEDRCDTEKYVQDVNAVGLCGVSDWRMPTVKELEGIAHHGGPIPAIDPSYFPNTPISRFWSGSPWADGSTLAWIVHFSTGASAGDRRNSYSDHGVRLVRAGQ
ncbi:MAG: DUF1566 domain-containing protein [Burkholderiales bacterium]|nr:DUF1566 domain-containing protein [Burkholderiales bacterium]